MFSCIRVRSCVRVSAFVRGGPFIALAQFILRWRLLNTTRTCEGLCLKNRKTLCKRFWNSTMNSRMQSSAEKKKRALPSNQYLLNINLKNHYRIDLQECYSFVSSLFNFRPRSAVVMRFWNIGQGYAFISPLAYFHCDIVFDRHDSELLIDVQFYRLDHRAMLS